MVSSKRNTDYLLTVTLSSLPTHLTYTYYMYVVPELRLSAPVQEIVKCKQSLILEILLAEALVIIAKARLGK
jgi:hypothetical protein